MYEGAQNRSCTSTFFSSQGPWLQHKHVSNFAWRHDPQKPQAVTNPLNLNYPIVITSLQLVVVELEIRVAHTTAVVPKPSIAETMKYLFHCGKPNSEGNQHRRKSALAFAEMLVNKQLMRSRWIWVILFWVSATSLTVLSTQKQRL